MQELLTGDLFRDQYRTARSASPRNRVIKLLCDELGYRYLGDRSDRAANSNVEEAPLSASLTKRGGTPGQTSALTSTGCAQKRTIPTARSAATNQAVYSLLRHGVLVKIEASEASSRSFTLSTGGQARRATTSRWPRKHPEGQPRAAFRPSCCMSSGIAVGVIELKNSRKSIGDGIRCKTFSNQQPEFNAWFFSTVQRLCLRVMILKDALWRHRDRLREVFPHMERG